MPDTDELNKRLSEAMRLLEKADAFFDFNQPITNREIENGSMKFLAGSEFNEFMKECAELLVNGGYIDSAGADQHDGQYW